MELTSLCCCLGFDISAKLNEATLIGEVNKRIVLGEKGPIGTKEAGTFSPRTIRLLTSPSKVASFNFAEILKPRQQQSEVSSKRLHQRHEIQSLRNDTCNKSFDSPNIKYINSHTTDALDQCPMPDMIDVLARFGIDASSPNKSMDEFTELSISQRIKTLRHNARYKPTSGTLETNHCISTDFVETSPTPNAEENNRKPD